MSTIVRPATGPASGMPSAVARLAGRIAGRDCADAWALPALAGVTALAAVLYLLDLTVSGYANTYYALAAQAASQSWSAWFFGSLDASNFITLDKPPLATMVMGLSVRLFDLSSWSILLPQALMGVGTVAVLFVVVRRSFGTVAATIAGAVMALTPAAVLIFRFDNPDALLTLLLVMAAWALLRALDAGRLRWLALAGTLVGLGFMTKFLQAWLVLPVFAIVWAVAAPGGWRRRIAGLIVAAGAVTIASLAWPVAVELIPAASRPYIGGSTGNSVFDLVLGYDGLGRILGGVGNSGGGASGGAGGMGFVGETGILRMFNSQFGGQVAWFIPYALVALASGLWLRRRAGRRDGRLVGYLLWGGWLVVHVLVFSFMSGVIHSYYVVALAPAVAALVGAGTVELWRLRAQDRVAGVVLAGTILASGAWAWALLERTPDFVPGLGVAILAITAAASLVVALPIAGRRRLATVAATVALAALLAGPAAYAAQTMATAHSGGDAAAGPSTSSGIAGGPGGLARTDGAVAAVPGGTADGAPPAAGTMAASGGPGGASGDGGTGGSSADATLIAYLAEHAGSARWIVAVSGSGTAATIQLASGLPVMAMGGFNGSDAAPTLEQLQAYVASGELRYVLLGGGGGGGGGPSSSSTSGRDAWVASACTVVDTGATSGTLYDCAGATGG
jgi:4-amino-4-deoxy-L-arabinose transferase-like glycosyltransferase